MFRIITADEYFLERKLAKSVELKLGAYHVRFTQKRKGKSDYTALIPTEEYARFAYRTLWNHPKLLAVFIHQLPDGQWKVSFRKSNNQHYQA